MSHDPPSHVRTQPGPHSRAPEPQPERSAFRHAPLPAHDRVEVAVLGALGRLARRLGDSPLSLAR